MMYKIISVQNKSRVSQGIVSRLLQPLRNLFRTQKKPDRAGSVAKMGLIRDVMSVTMGFLNEVDQGTCRLVCEQWDIGYGAWLTVESKVVEKNDKQLRETMPKGQYFGLDELELYFGIKLSAREKVSVMASVNLEKLIPFSKWPMPDNEGTGKEIWVSH